MISRWLKGSLLAVAVLGSGCGLTANNISCTRKNDTTKLPEKCIELSDFKAATLVEAKASLSVLCQALSASIESKQCDASTAVLGCEQVGSAWTTGTWYYATTDKPTAADYSCPSSDQRRGPDRMPLGDPDMSVSHDLVSHD